MCVPARERLLLTAPIVEHSGGTPRDDGRKSAREQDWDFQRRLRPPTHGERPPFLQAARSQHHGLPILGYSWLLHTLSPILVLHPWIRDSEHRKLAAKSSSTRGNRPLLAISTPPHSCPPSPCPLALLRAPRRMRLLFRDAKWRLIECTHSSFLFHWA